MKKLTSLQRVLTTIRRQEPDKVPTFESHIDENVRNMIKPGLSYEDFIEYMDLDAIVHFDIADEKYEVLNDKGYVRDQWGAVRRWTKGSRLVPAPVEAPIRSEEDLERYVPPDPDLPWRYQTLQRYVKRFRGERAVIATVMDPFQTVRDSIRGLIPYFEDLALNPDLADRINEMALNYHRRYAENCMDVGVDIIWMTGDIATMHGPFLSPAMTERFIIPAIADIARVVHQRGLPFLKHTDGNIMEILDMLIGAGIDAIHPIDPTAGMKLEEVKTRYGDRVCLMGNVDCAQLLPTGTAAEVRETVKKCIQDAGKGGGYICTTSNTVHPTVRPENYVAMVQAIKDYGKYPLSV